jgi:hypothetical protein
MVEVRLSPGGSEGNSGDEPAWGKNGSIEAYRPHRMRMRLPVTRTGSREKNGPEYIYIQLLVLSWLSRRIGIPTIGNYLVSIIV